ncbi:MAG: hypothetical protein C4340_00920, partial [Armatimonadota bacterium]
MTRRDKSERGSLERESDAPGFQFRPARKGVSEAAEEGEERKEASKASSKGRARKAPAKKARANGG